MAEARGRVPVAITGMGTVNVLGPTVAAFAESLMAGRSGITRWKEMDPRIYSKIGGDLCDFDLKGHLQSVGADYPAELARQTGKLLRSNPAAGKLTAAAAVQAFLDADAGALPGERTAHVLAGHNVTTNYFVRNTIQLIDEPDFIDPLLGLISLDTDALSVVSELLGIRGPSFLVGGACASGNLALLSGLDLIRSGRADTVVVTGAATDCDPLTLQGWALVDALSFRSFNDEPERASRPFDALREGFVPSQGAGAVVLEPLDQAQARGVRVHALLLGAGSASDASRLPKPYKIGQMTAMTAALADAGVEPGQVDYVNAHATSTPLGDAVEVSAIKGVLGARAMQIPINSTKSMLGHCLCAASLCELIATVVQLQAGAVHPTINQEQPDPEIDVDVVPNVAREHRVQTAISNSFGFGGLNSCVVVGRAD